MAYSWAIDSLLDTSSFASASPPLTPNETDQLAALANRLKSHLGSGRFRLSVPNDKPLGETQSSEVNRVWTTQLAYQDVSKITPNLLAELMKSDLVNFRG